LGMTRSVNQAATAARNSTPPTSQPAAANVSSPAGTDGPPALANKATCNMGDTPRHRAANKTGSSSKACARRGCPFKVAETPRADRPARLADGLGLESAPIHRGEPAPRAPGLAGAIGSPAPAPGGTGLGCIKTHYRYSRLGGAYLSRGAEWIARL